MFFCVFDLVRKLCLKSFYYHSTADHALTKATDAFTTPCVCAVFNSQISVMAKILQQNTFCMTSCLCYCGNPLRISDSDARLHYEYNFVHKLLSTLNIQCENKQNNAFYIEYSILETKLTFTYKLPYYMLYPKLDSVVTVS